MPMKIYHKLAKRYGKQNWWSMSGAFRPEQFEICIGAILTQNTNWRNVEKALKNLTKSKKLTAESIASCPLPELKRLVKPSGFYNQKAKSLKTLAKFVIAHRDFYKDVTREQLLGIKGIGRETADSILLYACNKPYFVVDAYTRRIFSRLDVIDSDNYDNIREFFECALPRSARLYGEFHALIVEHAKDICKKKPLCKKCVLAKVCKNFLLGENKVSV